jgi:RNA polymerase sigma-70 factor (ECF subfamily)
MVRRLAWRYCRARLVRAEQAEERAGEICRAVFQALPGYRDQGEPFLAFVYGIAAGKVADARHRTARRRPAAPPGMLPERDYPVGETHGRRIGAAAAELPARLARGLEALPEQQREVLVLRVALGLSIAETATALGISPEAVRIAGHRGLSALRAHPARGLLGEHPGAGGDMPGRERAAETTTPRIPTRTSPP